MCDDAKRASSDDGSESVEPSKRQRTEDTAAPAPEATAAAPAPAPAAAAAASSAPAAANSDELIKAAPKLIAAMRTSAAKCLKVAEKVASLLEEGRVIRLSNAGAVFDILSAGVEDPIRWRRPEVRPAFRRLYSAAATRLSYFPVQQQQSIRVWQLGVVTLIDLMATNPDVFAKAVLELRKYLLQIPCANPADEPRSSAQPGYSHLQVGAREYLPERTRPAWCLAIADCLAVVVAKFEGPRAWARADVNGLVKLAALRRQNFRKPQQEQLDGWERERRADAMTAVLDKADCL